MGVTQATIVVSFSDDANSDGFYVAELDEVANNGRTQFVPNEEVYFLVQHDVTLQILNIVSTNGSVRSTGTVTRTREQVMLWVEEGEEQSLSHMGSVSFAFSFSSTGLSVNGVSVTASGGSFPALCKATITGQFKQYCLTPQVPALAKDETFDVYIVIYFGPA